MLVRRRRLEHHTALRLCGVNCTACVSPLRGDVGASESFWGGMLGEDVLLKSGAAGLGVVGQDVDAVAEEVAVAAGGLEESAVEPERLVAHEVEHSVHLARIGEHLAMVSHPLAAFDLFCVFVVGHKKIVELCLCPLRCSTTCPTIK